MTEYETYRVLLSAGQILATLISPCVMLYFMNKGK